MNDNITINEEGLMEVSPTASRDATTAFIDTYRQLQGENTAQIGSAAHALGSDLTAQYGGLHGPSEYIKSRYQTPQTESRIAALQTTAQLNALNQLMQNEQNKWRNRYNQAYRNYQKRASSSGGSGGGTTTGGGNGDVLGEAIDEFSGADTMSISSAEDRFATADKPRVTNISANGAYYNGYPTVNTTIDNPNVAGDDELVGYYGPTQSASYTPTFQNVASSVGNTLSKVYGGPLSWPLSALSNILGRL